MSFAKRIVFDTSTLVSAALKPRSTPARALSWGWEVAQVVVSSDTLGELQRVLDRSRLDAFREREARLRFFAHDRAMTVLLDVTEPITACRDPQDDKFLSLAVSAKASVLVSSDQDLLCLCRFRGIHIMQPQAFVALCE